MWRGSWEGQLPGHTGSFLEYLAPFLHFSPINGKLTAGGAQGFYEGENRFRTFGCLGRMLCLGRGIVPPHVILMLVPSEETLTRGSIVPFSIEGFS